jgi:GDP/UDP-N,N'-diacetylbacillosamine 2-epimerase (hydrolysing)
MGTKIYLSFIKSADVVIGNSSSGIYEAPALKTITLNIGNRQEGRIFGSSVINSKNETNEIIKKLKKIYRNKSKIIYENVYYKKNVSGIISSKIKKILKEKDKMKKFYDIKF